MTHAPVPELEEFLAPDSVSSEAWQVTDTSSADWAMRKLAGARTRMEARCAEAEAWHEKINVWLEAALKEDSQLAERMEFLLTEYMIRVRTTAEAEGHKPPAALPLPSGTITARKAPGSVVVSDEAAFIAWALLNHEEWVQMVHTPLKKDIKRDCRIKHGRLVDDNGEILPGIVHQPSGIDGVVFAVKTGFDL